jgi:hypothetical protein
MVAGRHVVGMRGWPIRITLHTRCASRVNLQVSLLPFDLGLSSANGESGTVLTCAVFHRTRVRNRIYFPFKEATNYIFINFLISRSSNLFCRSRYQDNFLGGSRRRLVYRVMFKLFPWDLIVCSRTFRITGYSLKYNMHFFKYSIISFSLKFDFLQRYRGRGKLCYPVFYPTTPIILSEAERFVVL